MKSKRDPVIAGLMAAACCIAFVSAVTSLQAEPPSKLPVELAPTRQTELVEPLTCSETVDEPEAEAAIEPTDLGEFKLTAYCTCEKCCGQWADGITYTGTQATAGRTVAVDPDIIPLGSKVYIDGVEYIAEDIGGVIKGKHIDVLLTTHEAAQEFGVQYAHVSILN